MKKGELFQTFFMIIFFLLIFFVFDSFLLENSKFFIILVCFLLINYIIILLSQRKLGRKNFPYKPYKSKKSILNRILLGFLAGFHYFFFIGSYDHKKYNTQVWHPETLECYFGNISQLIVIFIYGFIAFKLLELNLYYSISFMFIPILTNLISLKSSK